MTKVFPIRLYCSDIHYAASPELAKSIWLRNPDRRSWYATDCSVIDATTVEVYVYDMANNFSGGIGKEIYRFTETNLTKEEQVVVGKLILGRQLYLAEDEWERREEQRRNNEIEKLRREMYG